ncbi:D-alanine--D-alanine ligase [Rhodoluna sp. KAS3]|uniref:D-alanine--D-alanine ligase family protein n=1 Tax=Rhodoluna sp. KAS3 TaxID=942880 RepID=UPI0022306918|nr:D-alanine--D-alanine ligase [Rhodoluna sp. KAS3]BDS49730.1 D-alanine--D-alanine ligase [Rhodoluna sp. KAS3]
MIVKGNSAAKLKIQVLAGGISHERDISLKSGRRVADALTDFGAEVVIREPDHDLLANILKDKPDVIWPCLHGASGEDGALRDILALTGVPFVGASAASARLAWDKSIAKVLVAQAGIQTPPSVTLPKETFRELDAEGVLKAVTQSISLPVVVKPAKSGSAQGVSIVHDQSELNRAMIDAYVYCDVAIIEKFIAGTELAVSVIDLGAGPIALPAVEIEPVDGKFGYDERYTAGETNYFVPARLTPKLADKASEIAIKAHELLGLRHLSRIDLIVDDQGAVWFLEANVLPGLTETSLLPQAVTASGNSLGEVYYSLAEAARNNRG